MKKSKSSLIGIQFLLFLTIIFVSCKSDINDGVTPQAIVNASGTLSKAKGTVVNLLWNQNLKYKSYMHRNITTGENPVHIGCDLSQAHLVGNPSNIWPFSYTCDDGVVISAQNNSAPSTTWVSLGYNNADFKKYPGFDMQCFGNGNGSALEFQFANNCKTMANPSNLREVGFVFEHWPDNPGNWSFRDQYKLSQFAEIRPYFDAKLTAYTGPGYSSWPAVYLSADFRFSYRDINGNAIRTDLIGVIFSNPSHFDGNNNANDAIAWQGWSGTNYELIGGVPMARIFVHADKLNINYSHTVSGVYKNYSLDYWPLIKTFLPPPPSGLTYDNAVITGFDVYSSSRQADITFYVKNIQLYGIE